MSKIEYISFRSPELTNIIRGLELTHELYVATILIGEPYIGKRTLIRQIFPDIPQISAKDKKELETALNIEESLVITDFEELDNPDKLDFQNKRVIAIANKTISSRVLDDKFAFIYKVPPLKERKSELKEFISYFLKKAKEDLMVDIDITIDSKRLDLSKNLLSLRASIYKEVLINSMGFKDIEEVLKSFFYKSLDGDNAYRDNLPLFERPLLKSGLNRYGSQLKLSKVLGINRNTLRKKLNEYQLD